ncbi:DGAT1/2-independent enzyme synthesizing storage lipids-like [Pituophis catenifer annectens]|uniref:DGAT1/2-independent enzyme synthesizing storage lipids-like n=1 Tax=Pituophis catenifer annectens TaxID=94852 RepID=UPI003991F4EE
MVSSVFEFSLFLLHPLREESVTFVHLKPYFIRVKLILQASCLKQVMIVYAALLDFYSCRLSLNMTAENIFYTPRKEYSIWSTYILEECAGFMVYPITVLAILILLYYPFIFAFSCFYATSLVFHVWKKIGNLPEDTSSKQWDMPRKIYALVTDLFGKILHSYEISGLENLPEGPAILVYYHGAFPIDYHCFVIRLYRLTGRISYSVVDHVLSFFPGLKLFLSVYHCDCYTRERCINVLKQGHLLGVAPGGKREQNYGNHQYKVIWRKRKGFAQIAIDAKVPIIPLFTQNIREGYMTYVNTRAMRWFYERNRWLPFPMCGMFPVKLITHIGKPIPYDPDITPEKLAEKTQRAIEDLRDKHQKIPGSILHALRQRFEAHNKDK